MAALTGVGATGAPGSVSISKSIPLTGVFGRGRVGSVVSETTASSAITLRAPLPALALTGVTGEAVGLTLRTPVLQFALTGDTGTVGALDLGELFLPLTMTGTVPELASLLLEPPSITLAMTGIVGSTGQLTIRSPAMRLSMGSGDTLTLEVPLPALALQGTSGVRGALTIRAPRPAMALAGAIPVLGTLALRAPRTGLSMSAYMGATGTLTLRAPKLAAALSGVVGGTGTLAIGLPLPEVMLQGALASVGVLVLRTPPPWMSLLATAPLYAPADVEASVTAMALQTERMALTQYTNFPFNSFAVFAGRHLAASASGIYSLTGDTDDGTAIAAAARVGISDWGTSQVKRATRIYVGYRTTGAVRMRLWTDETQERVYAVPPAVTSGLHGAHVRLGMGVDARYWQWEMVNHNGADFSVDCVEVKPTPLRHRVGGKDA